MISLISSQRGDEKQRTLINVLCKTTFTDMMIDVFDREICVIITTTSGVITNSLGVITAKGGDMIKISATTERSIIDGKDDKMIEETLLSQGISLDDKDKYAIVSLISCGNEDIYDKICEKLSAFIKQGRPSSI